MCRYRDNKKRIYVLLLNMVITDELIV